MIKRLEWDSDFFGYAVGQIEIKNSRESILMELIEKSKSFKLVYVISEEELHIKNQKFELVDIKTRLRKEISAQQIFLVENVKEYDGGQNEELRKLALQSGAYSRFKTDKHFKNNEFERLYLKWIEDSINKRIADRVIVYENEGHFCVGFVTIQLKDDFSEIGLIAVDEQSRGKGIAKELLDYTDRCTIINGLNKIEVVTQFKNLPAIKLYEKAGYKIISTKYIYHLWN